MSSLDVTSQEVRGAAEKVLGNPILFPDEFKTWLSDFVATNVPLIPFSHIFGARLNTARSGQYVATSESTTSAAYTDLATVGPQVTNLSDGTYLIVYGAESRSRYSVSINGAAASDDDSIYCVEAVVPAARAKISSLKNNNANTICMKYINGSFKNRWMVVVRIGAP